MPRIATLHARGANVVQPRRNRTAPERTPTTWRNRIVGSGEEPPEQLLANPANWRIHPRGQQQALAARSTLSGGSSK
jgi:hypothetical protein